MKNILTASTKYYKILLPGNIFIRQEIWFDNKMQVKSLFSSILSDYNLIK